MSVTGAVWLWLAAMRSAMTARKPARGMTSTGSPADGVGETGCGDAGDFRLSERGAHHVFACDLPARAGTDQRFEIQTGVFGHASRHRRDGAFGL